MRFRDSSNKEMKLLLRIALTGGILKFCFLDHEFLESACESITLTTKHYTFWWRRGGCFPEMEETSPVHSERNVPQSIEQSVKKCSM